MQRNTNITGDHRNGHRSITTSDLPTGLSTVPFVWNYLGTTYNMDFVAGFTSFTQDPDTYAVRPKIGWAVRDKPTSTVPGFPTSRRRRE